MSDKKLWNALNTIVGQLPEKLVPYGFMLGAIAIAGASPQGAEAIVGGIGAGLFTNGIQKVADGKKVSPDEIRRIVEEEIRTSGIANPLKERDFLFAVSRIIQRQDVQQEGLEDIRDILINQMAKAEQVEEVKHLLQYLISIFDRPLQHYLDVVLPGHLQEVMPPHVFKGLKSTFVDTTGEVREQIPPVRSEEEPDWELFGADVWDKPPEIELGGELRPPRDGHYSDKVEYTDNVRERIKKLHRVVLLGEPGAGKTFILGRLALDYADNYRADPNAPLPVFVPLSQYDTAQTFEVFVAARMGGLGERLGELRVFWLLDALNEMPRDGGQWQHLKTFINGLVEKDTPFILSCRVRNYDEDLRDVHKKLHRIDLQDLNPQQIYDILVHFLRAKYTDHIWETVMHAGKPDGGLLAAWRAWQGGQNSVRDFWEKPQGSRFLWDTHQHAFGRIHDDPRKLMLLCRNPFTLVQMVVMRLGKAIHGCGGDLVQLAQELEEHLPNNRGRLFEAVINDMLQAEAERRKWADEGIRAIRAALEFTAAALQATKQRTEMRLAELLSADGVPADIVEHLKMGRDAGLITLSEQTVRFNHQLYQEYFATKKLRDLLEDYSQRHPQWEAGPPLPPRDKGLAKLFPQWWEPGGWRVTVALLGKLEGPTGISRVLRWLAGYTPEVALQMVLDNNDGLTVQDLDEAARSALIAGARAKTGETDPHGRAATYRALSLLDADKRPGVGVIVRDGLALPDIAWSEPIPPGEYPIGGDKKAWISLPAEKYKLEYSYQVSKYPVTYAQFRVFQEEADGFSSKDYNWFEGLAADGDDRQAREQESKYSNHPCERVNWYQALAYCRWLSWRLGGRFYKLDEIALWPVRLPTEKEWEIAARGPEGRVYPYSGIFDAAKGNTRGTGIYQTSAVGIFPAGVSWCGALDMSGNVWEWCINLYGKPEGGLQPEHLRSSSVRVLRGGSWSSSHNLARAASRPYGYPFNPYSDAGFRLCRLPHLMKN